ncbi:hypothetical protein ACOSQ2_031991 [Xanthoceras sorbifolium]
MVLQFSGFNGHFELEELVAELRVCGVNLSEGLYYVYIYRYPRAMPAFVSFFFCYALFLCHPLELPCHLTFIEI